MKMTARISPVAEQKTAKRGTGIAGAGAGGPSDSDRPGVRERRRHAVVLEAARWVQALVLQKQPSRLQSDVAGHDIGLLQDGLPFADGQHFIRRGERQ